MGLSIFYSMSMRPAALEEDVMNGLYVLRSDVVRLVHTHLPEAKVAEITRLTGPEMGLVQTDPSHPLFGFCRQAGRPIGVRTRAPLGSLPELGISFTVHSHNEFEIPFGVCRYDSSTPIDLNWASTGDLKYDGRWFFYNYCDPMTRLNRSIARTVLELARRSGFDVTIKDEDHSPFDSIN